MKKYLFLIFFLAGCSYKTTPVIVAFKKNNFAINDQGFIKHGLLDNKIEVYNVGHLAFVMRVTPYAICINEKCYIKHLFIKQLNPSYPDDLFDLILTKKPLKDIKIYKTKQGFIQKTKDFIYIVSKNKVVFKDKKKRFLFMIKEKNPTN